jgi:hypothetical protein
MAVKAMIETIINLHKDYCCLGDPLTYDLMAWFEVHTHGADLLKHPSHFSITGPDDFANDRLGKMIEAISWNPSVTTFSDLSLQSKIYHGGIGTRIIYVDKKLRHSSEYERLCQLTRDRYLNNGQTASREPAIVTPVVIIGNGGLIDRKIINRTILLYVTPFPNPVPAFLFSKVENKVIEAKAHIEKFWKDDLPTILDSYDTFPKYDWLKNQDEQCWFPILAPVKAYSDLLHQPVFFENMLTLAKKMVTSRKMEEAAIPLEQKVLEAALAFLEDDKNKPMERKPKHNPQDDFYYGPDLFKSIQDKLKLERPKLTKEEISEILNDHEVVKDTWRPRIEVDDEKASTKDKQVKKITQPTCYAINREILAETLRNYRKSG